MKKVTCYGTGVIGTAWGAVFLKGGCEVTFFDIGEEQLQTTKNALEGVLAFFRSQNMMTPEQCAEALLRTRYTTDPAQAVEGAQFIQENCPESVALKQKVLATIKAHCPADAISPPAPPACSSPTSPPRPSTRSGSSAATPITRCM